MKIVAFIYSRGYYARYRLTRMNDGQLAWEKNSLTNFSKGAINDGTPALHIDVELEEGRALGGTFYCMPESIPYENSHLEPTYGN